MLFKGVLVLQQLEEISKAQNLMPEYHDQPIPSKIRI